MKKTAKNAYADVTKLSTLADDGAVYHAVTGRPMRGSCNQYNAWSLLVVLVNYIIK